MKYYAGCKNSGSMRQLSRWLLLASILVCVSCPIMARATPPTVSDNSATLTAGSTVAIYLSLEHNMDRFRLECKLRARNPASTRHVPTRTKLVRVDTHLQCIRLCGAGFIPVVRIRWRRDIRRSHVQYHDNTKHGAGGSAGFVFGAKWPDAHSARHSFNKCHASGYRSDAYLHAHKFQHRMELRGLMRTTVRIPDTSITPRRRISPGLTHSTGL